MDQSAFPSVPDFVKSLSVDRIMDDPDVLVAYEMNGQTLPMLNGYPARLIVPGWFATYWVKNLSDILVLDKPFEGFWVKTGYRIPDTACGCIAPGTAPKRTVPINRMTVRSFIIVPENGARLPAGGPVTLKGIAFDGGYGIQQVEGGRSGSRHNTEQGTPAKKMILEQGCRFVLKMPPETRKWWGNLECLTPGTAPTPAIPTGGSANTPIGLPVSSAIWPGLMPGSSLSYLSFA